MRQIKVPQWLKGIVGRRPDAVAVVKGSNAYPQIMGTGLLYQRRERGLVVSSFEGLPEKKTACGGPVFGIHIHEGTSCTGNETDPFADAKGHYNPNNCAHPYHAGDLPPVFSNNGSAFNAVLTNRFHVREVLGRVVILHSMPDDFTTQPSGNSGEKIACGVIQTF